MLSFAPQSILIRWTKGFQCSGVEGEDVVKLLKEAISRQVSLTHHLHLYVCPVLCLDREQKCLGPSLSEKPASAAALVTLTVNYI